METITDRDCCYKATVDNNSVEKKEREEGEFARLGLSMFEKILVQVSLPISITHARNDISRTKAFVESIILPTM